MSKRDRVRAFVQSVKEAKKNPEFSKFVREFIKYHTT